MIYFSFERIAKKYLNLAINSLKGTCMEKVFIVVPRLIGHGMERMAVLAAESITDKYDTELIIFTDKDQDYSTDIKIVNLGIPSKTGNLAKCINAFRRTAALRNYRKKCNPIAVISFGTSANIVNVLSKGKGKTIISFRGYASITKDITFYLTCIMADWIFCISKGMLDHLRQLYRPGLRKSSVVYNSIDIKAIFSKMKEKVNFQPPHPAFVAMGRLEPVKGQRHLLNAFSLVLKEIPYASLTIIGEGSERKNLQKQVTELGITDNIIFLGSKTNPFPYLTCCDICVGTSITEGFQNVLIEAGACGLAVISVDCHSGPREILSERYTTAPITDIEMGEYGILVPSFVSNESEEPEKEIILANAMLLLCKDADLRNMYAKKMKKRTEYFSVDKYKNDIHKLIKGR